MNGDGAQSSVPRLVWVCVLGAGLHAFSWCFGILRAPPRKDAGVSGRYQSKSGTHTHTRAGMQVPHASVTTRVSLDAQLREIMLTVEVHTFGINELDLLDFEAALTGVLGRA